MRIPPTVWKLPGLAMLRRSGWLNQKLRLGYGVHWGAFKTRSEALEFLRPDDMVEYDNDAVVQIHREIFTAIHPFDWPIMFFLSQLEKDGKLQTVTDLGGHVGVKYLAFKTLIIFPENLRWQVVDVPAMCREGRRRQSPETEALSFYEDSARTEPCDLLICSGVLQYLDHTLGEAVQRLPAKPGHVLLNKVAVSENEAFYTLESFGIGRMPYHITTLADLNKVRETLGYTLIARWDIPYRTFEVASANGTHKVKMVGEAWRA